MCLNDVVSDTCYTDESEIRQLVEEANKEQGGGDFWYKELSLKDNFSPKKTSEIVFGANIDSIERRFDEIINNELKIYEEIITYQKSKNNPFLKTNFRKIKGILGNTAERGFRCNVAHVDKNLPVWVLHEIIKPATMAWTGHQGQIKYF